MKKETLKAIAAHAGTTMAGIAAEMGTSKQGLNNKFVRDGFKEEDLKDIASAVGGTYVGYVRFPDGVKIGDDIIPAQSLYEVTQDLLEAHRTVSMMIDAQKLDRSSGPAQAALTDLMLAFASVYKLAEALEDKKPVNPEAGIDDH